MIYSIFKNEKLVLISINKINAMEDNELKEGDFVLVIGGTHKGKSGFLSE
ncbi:hypothetical protein [Sphingobacteruim zhuxiongii]|nr:MULTISPECIES: hypothetical protein [unclassified Sphingobacterium]